MLFLEAPMAVLSGRTIVLDPGHGEVCEGENDPGAVNPRLHLQERDAVRRQADLVRAGLQALGASVKILENGTTKSPRELGAEGKGCDCFVSLHLNAFNNQAQGHLVLIDSNGTATDEKLAKMINEELNQRLAIADRGVRRQPLGVLKGVPLPAPAVLVESFFLDSARSTKDVYQWLQQSADGITAGVKTFLAS